jgi:uncharacterized radical SAM protein YgiQ
MADMLPTTRDELIARGWNLLDIILVTGDAYVDHPSYGAAVIGRVLESAGFRVGIIAQPDWRNIDDFMRLGRPRLFFGITSGNLDSMVSNYTSHKKRRRVDVYSPGGRTGLRPDRAVIVYANRIREAYKDTNIVLGGIEASLRRLSHYDWWDNAVRRSILLDARADILVYGMGERQVIEIARRISGGTDLYGIPGTAVIGKDVPQCDDFLEIPSYEETRDDKAKFINAFRAFYANQDPFRGKILAQRHDKRYVIQFPPSLPFSPDELDVIYGLPFTRAAHKGDEPPPGMETVKFSIVSHRGCCGACSFCSLSMHQGMIIQSRSRTSILDEAKRISEMKDFRGTITDVGGPTANLYGSKCPKWSGKGHCGKRDCLIPTKCGMLKLGYNESMELYRAILSLPRVKHMFIESGIRYDLLVDDTTGYFEHLCEYHVSGQMKVAPEHTVNSVLRVMNKPAFQVYERFVDRFKAIQKQVHKDQYMVNYFISAHPGATMEDEQSLSTYLRKRNMHPEQVQDFTPLPSTVASCMYHTEEHPFTGEILHVAKSLEERNMHRAVIQHQHSENRRVVRNTRKPLAKTHKR